MKLWLTIIVIVLGATSVLGTAQAGRFDGVTTTTGTTTTPTVIAVPAFDPSDIRAFRQLLSIEDEPVVQDGDDAPAPFATCSNRKYDGCPYYVKTIGCSVNCVGWCPPVNSSDPDCFGKKCFCATPGQ